MITYPVAEGSKWAVYDTDLGQVIARNKPWPRADGMEIVGAPANLVPLLHVRLLQPLFSRATHKLVEAPEVVDVPNNTLTRGWSVVPLSAGELQMVAAAAATKTEIDQARAAYTALMNGAGTTAERLVRVERVTARLLKSLYQ